MTYDFDQDSEENIVNLIEKPQEVYVKSPRYRSVHSRRAREELVRSKSAHKTLGVAQVRVPEPRDYLRKRSAESRNRRPVTSRSSSRHVHYRRPGYEHRLPDWQPVKRHKEPNLPGPDPFAACSTDFTKRNVEIVKGLRPKAPRQRFVDTRRGDSQDLMASGMKPIYIYKQNFGKVPDILKKQASPIKEKQTNREKFDDKKPLCRYVTEDEREELLQKLKEKWTDTMKQFQCLPFIIDSVAKIKRKIMLEEKLKQLEKDIKLIENHPYIYVYDDKDNEI